LQHRLHNAINIVRHPVKYDCSLFSIEDGVSGTRVTIPWLANRPRVDDITPLAEIEDRSVQDGAYASRRTSVNPEGGRTVSVSHETVSGLEVSGHVSRFPL